jgi:hypothetical protein
VQLKIISKLPMSAQPAAPVPLACSKPPFPCAEPKPITGLVLVISTDLQFETASHLFGLHASLLTAHKLSVVTCEHAWLEHVSTVQLTLSVGQSVLLRHS